MARKHKEKITPPDGSENVGEVQDDSFSGQGTAAAPDGRKYVGEFKNGLPNGQGTFTHPNGDKYVGQYKNGAKHGQGTLTHTNGYKYEGEFRDDSFNGHGTETSPGYGTYVGEFKNGLRHGQGTVSHPDGSKYVGELKDGEIHGQGTLTHPDGSKYVGELKDGEIHGQGKFTNSDGEELEGEFKDGELIIGDETMSSDQEFMTKMVALTIGWMSEEAQGIFFWLQNAMVLTPRVGVMHMLDVEKKELFTYNQSTIMMWLGEDYSSEGGIFGGADAINYSGDEKLNIIEKYKMVEAWIQGEKNDRLIEIKFQASDWDSMINLLILLLEEEGVRKSEVEKIKSNWSRIQKSGYAVESINGPLFEDVNDQKISEKYLTIYNLTQWSWVRDWLFKINESHLGISEPEIKSDSDESENENAYAERILKSLRVLDEPILFG